MCICVFVFFNLFFGGGGGNVYVSDYNLIIVSPPHKKLSEFISPFLEGLLYCDILF